MGNKFVMVGGGSTQSPGILEVLRKRAKELNLSDLVLYDIDEERVSLLGQYTKMYYKELGSKVNVTYTTNIDHPTEKYDFHNGEEHRPTLTNVRLSNSFRYESLYPCSDEHFHKLPQEQYLLHLNL